MQSVRFTSRGRLFWAFLTVLCGLGFFASAGWGEDSAATPSVTLSPNDYVLMGRTVHLLKDSGSDPQWDFKDSGAGWVDTNLNIRPILWRVMPNTVDASKAMLMSEYLLVLRNYDDIVANNKTWNVSTLQKWLNKETGGSTWDPTVEAGDSSFGFLDDRRFTTAERNAMLAFTWGTDGTISKMALPASDDLKNGGTFGFADNSARIGTFRSASDFDVAGGAYEYWVCSDGA